MNTQPSVCLQTKWLWVRVQLQSKSNNLHYLIKNINRLFVLLLKNSNHDSTKDSFDNYLGLARKKKQAHGRHSPSSIQGEWLAMDDQKNKILASFCLASYLAANWLQKLETKHCVYYVEVISVLMCVCVVSQFDLFIKKQNYLFVRCQFLSHIPNTSLRCSNQPLWKLNLMTGKHDKTTDGGN